MTDRLIVHITYDKMPTFILAGLLMVTLLHTLSAVAFVQAEFILSTLRVFLFGLFTVSTSVSKLTATQSSLLNQVPLDARTAMKKLGVYVNDIIEYAVCPTCYAIYPPDTTKPDDAYPHHCTHSQTDLGVCGMRLVNKKKLKPLEPGGSPRTVYEPIKCYPYRSLKSWLAELFMRRDIEELLLKSWDSAVGASGKVCHDILGSPVVQQFVGPDGKTLFSVQPYGSIHLVFSLFIDWFNPHGNKRAGKSHSIGAIYMACENLPPHLRFRPENIYLAGIIPGPHEPGVDQFYHFLRPLVDELLELWHKGLDLQCTGLRNAGRLIRAAIILLVCDLPALRKVGGFTHHAATHFCSFCRLKSKEASSIDRENWPRAPTWSEQYQIAVHWREALSEQERKDIFDVTGLRWSELLRLDYWDPTRFALIDTMHNLFLGELRHHVMEVFRLDVVAAKKVPKRQLRSYTPDEQQDVLNTIRRAMCNGARLTLESIRRDFLLAVAQFNYVVGVNVEPTKKAIVKALLDWVG